MTDHDSARADQFLTFTIADDSFAIPILRVREIIQNAGVTRVPQVPACIRGVINLRGGVVPVIDIGVKFGRAERTLDGSTCIVIVEVVQDLQRSVMGVVADSVKEVASFRASDIEPPPEFGIAVRADYLLGLGRLTTGFALILDTDRVLSRAELLGEIAVDHVAATPVVPEPRHTAATAAA